MELFVKISEILFKHLRWKFLRKYLTDGIWVKHLIWAFCELVNSFREKLYLVIFTGQDVHDFFYKQHFYKQR